MRLIWILLIFFLNFSICEYDEYIKGGETIILTGHKGFIDLSEYWGAFRLKIKVTVKGGYFYDNYLKCGGSLYKPKSWQSYILNDKYYSDSQEYGTMSGTNYDYYTHYFSIPKGFYWNYIYLEFPSYHGDQIEVKVNSSGFNMIYLIIIIVVAIAAFIGICFYIRRKRRQKMVPIPPNIQPVQPMINTGYNPPYSTEQPMNQQPQTLY